MLGIKNSKKIYSIFLLVVAVFTTLSFLIAPTNIVGSESLQDQLNQVQSELDAIRNQKDQIQSQIDSNNYEIANLDAQASKLYGEVQVYQKEIDELALQIKEIELNIQILNQKIEENKKEIAESEETIARLELESDSRIKSSYMKYRVYGNENGSGSNLFNVDSINEYFKTVQYKDIIQNDTNKLMNEIATLRQELVTKKKELEENLVTVKKEKDAVDIRKVDLDKKKAELEVKINEYRVQAAKIQNSVNSANQIIVAISDEEQKKAAQAELIQQELFKQTIPTNQGAYVTAGRIIGLQGCTGLCTGAHLHFIVWDNGGYQDPCGYLVAGPVSGCGWGNKITTWPIKGEAYYTSAFGQRCFLWNGQNYCDFHTGADFAGVPWNTPIYAAHDGYIYKGTDPYGANYAIICSNANCNSGLKTGYWHLSSF